MPSARKIRSDSNASGPGPRPRYSFLSCLRRPNDAKLQVYSVEFFPSPSSKIFACCGGRRATIAELQVVDERTTIRIVRAFVDEDEKEDYYCSAWTVSDTITGKPLLCVGGESGVIKILDTEKCALQSYLSGHGGPVYDLQLHPSDSDLLFSCSKDESVRLWSLSARRCLVTFAGDQGHRDAVLSLDVHYSGSWLASSGMDNTVKVWELDSEAVQLAIQTGRKTSSMSIKEEDAERFHAPFIQFPAFTTRRVHTDYVDCVRWVGDLLMTKSIESKCVLWKPDTRRRPNSVAHLRTYPYDAGKLWYMRFGLTSDLTTMAVGCEDGRIFLFDVDSGGRGYQELKHDKMRSTVRSVRFSSDDRFLVACCDDGTVWVFEHSAVTQDAPDSNVNGNDDDEEEEDDDDDEEE
jgi:polycomb protein EED